MLSSAVIISHIRDRVSWEDLGWGKREGGVGWEKREGGGKGKCLRKVCRGIFGRRLVLECRRGPGLG